MKHDLYILFEAAWPWLGGAVQEALQYLQHPFAAAELFAAASGLLGALLLALKVRISAWGWVCFALSNAGWIAFSWGNSHWFLLVQQLGFSITSAIGIWKWLVEPAIEAQFHRMMGTWHPQFGEGDE